MLILLSPAKSLDEQSDYPETPTRPCFEVQAAQIAAAAAKLSAEDLKKIMGISDKLAEQNEARYANYKGAKTRPAIRTFIGDVYRGFDAASAEPDVIDYAQDHVRILSGLYGVLRPKDRMKPYRLEMGTRWSPEKGPKGKLTDHWGDSVANAVSKDIEGEGSNIILNLASNEYYAVVKGQLPDHATIIAPDFRVETAKGLQFQSFAAKVARGVMARWVCEHRIEDADALKQFDRDGWRYRAEGSTPERPLFVRTG